MKNFRQSYYDFFSAFYDRFVSLHSRVPQGEIKKYLADMVAGERCGKVLDVCCGTGSLLLELSAAAGTGGLAVGLDFSGGMLAVSARKTKSRPNIRHVRADASALPFASGSFDAVTCSHAFYELKGEAQERALREIARVLKPGSAFFMMEHDLPENRFVRALFYLRLASMGIRRAVSILHHERDTLAHHFRVVDKVTTPTGRSKIFRCRT
jgi:ubiquinone/menaquinone biosynthesis C-methylase UbiE